LPNSRERHIYNSGPAGGFMRAGYFTLSVALFLSSAAPASAESTAGPVRLVPHRAVYDLSLLRSGSGSHSVENAHGRIAFDFGGDSCNGYTLKYRQVTVLESGETGARTLDVRTATYETGDGRSIRFKTDSRLESTSDESVDGDADMRTDGSLAIHLKQPSRETLTVPGQAIFPSEHMKRLIEAARAGQTTLAVKLYDGSDDGKKVYDTLSLIGHRIEPGEPAGLEGPARQDVLVKLPRWPVTISYFTAGSGDQTPVYTISFELYDNGISRALKLDYGDFALKGELQSLEVLPYTACQQ
jgi:EipB-like